MAARQAASQSDTSTNVSSNPEVPEEPSKDKIDLYNLALSSVRDLESSLRQLKEREPDTEILASI